MFIILIFQQSLSVCHVSFSYDGTKKGGINCEYFICRRSPISIQCSLWCRESSGMLSTRISESLIEDRKFAHKDLICLFCIWNLYFKMHYNTNSYSKDTKYDRIDDN